MQNIFTSLSSLAIMSMRAFALKSDSLAAAINVSVTPILKLVFEVHRQPAYVNHMHSGYGTLKTVP